MRVRLVVLALSGSILLSGCVVSAHTGHHYPQHHPHPVVVMKPYHYPQHHVHYPHRPYYGHQGHHDHHGHHREHYRDHHRDPHRGYHH